MWLPSPSLLCTAPVCTAKLALWLTSWGIGEHHTSSARTMTIITSHPPPPSNTRPSPPAEGYIGNRRGETSERRVAVTEMKARQPRTCDCVPTG